MYLCWDQKIREARNHNECSQGLTCMLVAGFFFHFDSWNFYCLCFTIHFSQIEPNLLDDNDEKHPEDKEHDVQPELDDSGYLSPGQKRKNPTSLLDIECCQHSSCLKGPRLWKKDASSPAFLACNYSYLDLALLTICVWGSHFYCFRVLSQNHIEILSAIFNKTLLV